MQADYDGRQVVGIDLHRRRSVIVRMTEAGAKLAAVRIDNDPIALGLEWAASRFPDRLVWVNSCGELPVLELVTDLPWRLIVEF
jgi:hypothetical protein